MNKICYSDFWPGFVNDVKNQSLEWYFGEFIPGEYNTTIVDQNHDVLFFSIFGEAFKSPKHNSCKKIYYSAENMNRNFQRFQNSDYTISHHIPGNGSFGEKLEAKTHLRMPIFLRTFGPERLEKINSYAIDVDKEFSQKNGFCCLVTRHENATVRGEVFKKIHTEYKKVDSAGDGWNTMENNWTVPGWWQDLKSFASNYKFMIAIENRKVSGYTSEKLFNALRCKTVPIYWGDPKVDELINPDSFINVDDFDDYDELLEYIQYVDENNDIYKQILSASPLSCEVKEHSVYSEDNIRDFTDKIFDVK